MGCVVCGSDHLNKDGTRNGKQRYRCMDCGKRFLSEEPVERKNTYIVHFNTRVKVTPSIKLTRENYCEPTTEICDKIQPMIQGHIDHGRITVPNDMFTDAYHYTESYVNKQYEDTMYNFDRNMAFFQKLDHKDFNKCLNRFVKKYKFHETTDLKEVEGMNGAYIMVLDEYSQVYIGISNNIKRRILGHWSKRKEFDLLLFGNKETSILPIDAFGALDTTRLFYLSLRWEETYEMEDKLVTAFDRRYSLNRVAGGITDDNENSRNMELVASRRKRNLDES